MSMLKLAPRGTGARHGLGKLVATADNKVSRLTQVSHRAPARLLPYKAALASAVGSTNVAIGSYGGGLLGGDVVELDVTVESDATLALGTQASTKVYRTRGDQRSPAKQVLDASVGDGGLMVWAPDPLVPFAQSSYVGTQRFSLAPTASLVAIDWVGAGRAACGERWAFDSYTSRTEVRLCSAGEDPVATAAAAAATNATTDATTGRDDVKRRAFSTKPLTV